MAIEKSLFEKYLFEIDKQCSFCLMAYEDCLTAYEDLMHLFNSQRIDSSTQAERKLRKDRMWYSLQSFLVASANISKLLGFAKKHKTAENKANLRSDLGIEDDSALGSRTMRDHFEHFQVRLDTWFNESVRHNFVDMNIGPLSGVGGIDEHDFIRNFD